MLHTVQAGQIASLAFVTQKLRQISQKKEEGCGGEEYLLRWVRRGDILDEAEVKEPFPTFQQKKQ